MASMIMKKWIVSTLVLVFLALPSTVSAALTTPQINAVLSLLASFHVDAATLDSVTSALHGKVAGVSTLQFKRILALGSSGTDVRALQQFLISRGHLASGLTTGYFGTATQAAVQRFQISRGIVSGGTPETTGDGVVGPRTATAIQGSSAPAPLSPSSYTGSATLTDGQVFTPTNTTSRDCPTDWICPTTPIMDPATKIGFWYEPWYSKPGYTPTGYFKSGVSWTELTQYKPTYGYYWSGDPDNIDYEFDLLNELGADYLILDNTNLAVIADKGNIEKNIQAIFKENSERPLSKQIGLSVAIGGELWAAHSVESMDNSADFIYDTYVDQPVYYEVDGKPLLIDYNAYTSPNPTEPNWNDSRFTVRYATGIVDQTNPSIVESQKIYPGITKYGWWGWITAYPQYITSENVLMVPGADHTHRLVTDPNNACGTCSLHIDREGGKTFIDAWLTTIKAHPKNITIASWNDFSEENGIEPARPTISTAPKWVDYYGVETPDWYMQIASGYMHLRQGLMADWYYKDEDDSAVYKVVDSQFVYQGGLPHGHPVIILPAGTLKNLLGQSPSSNARVQGYKVVMPGNLLGGPASLSGATVRATGDGGVVVGTSNQNPYYIATQGAQTYTVSVPPLAGYAIGYTLCIDRTDCHESAPVSGDSVAVTLPSGENHYADLWWHYTADVTSPPPPSSPAPTATLTANGLSDISVKTSDAITFAWSSTNASSAAATVSSDTPDTCSSKLGLTVTKESGSYRLDRLGACRASHTYTITYTATDASDNKASASVIVHVEN